MPSFNQVNLVGNLTRDPELKFLPSKTAVAEFGIAMNRKYRTAGGEDREEVCFVDCSAFGKTAETINQYMRKGKPILVTGRLKYEQWEKDGQKRSKLIVIVENFQFIGGRDDPEGGSGGDAPARETSVKPKFDPRNKPKPGRGPDGPSSRPESPFGDEPQFSDADIPFTPAHR